jgi:undecaprenyl-diphosphatase
MLNIEFAILDFIQTYITSPIMDKVMVFITTLGNAGTVWIVVALLMLCTRKYRMTGVMLSLGLLGSLFFGNIILKPAFARLRPFQIKEGVELLIAPPHDYSFPSGHTLASAISATILLLRDRKLGYISLVLAILIAFSRLYLYVHFPTDVLGGAAIGMIIGIASVRTVKFLIAKNGADIK